MSQEHKTSDSFAVFNTNEPFKLWNFALNPLGPHDVEVKITHCGMCHSDLHTVNGDWGSQNWPIVPGHEIIGNVTAVGKDVKKFKVGQRVAMGPQAQSCRSCKQCKSGQETYCAKGFVGTYGAKLPDSDFITKGGYAVFNRTDEHFVFAVPDNLESATTAPILCAGITTFTPLKDAGVGKGSKVGVIGIGGLGHLGIQLAVAMGAEVTAFSTTANKAAEAKQFGAQHFVVSSDAAALKALYDTFDVILNTAVVHLDYDQYFPLLVARGTWVQLGAPPGKMQFGGSVLIFKHINVTGSLIGPPGYVEEMLQLCAKHNIKALIEETPFTADGINSAMKKIGSNMARYRMVINMAKH